MSVELKVFSAQVLPGSSFVTVTQDGGSGYSHSIRSTVRVMSRLRYHASQRSMKRPRRLVSLFSGVCEPMRGKICLVCHNKNLYQKYISHITYLG